MTSAYFEEIIPVTEVSIPDFLSKDVNTTDWYMVTGTITEIVKAAYGNVYISDGENDLYVYGIYPGYGATGDAR